MAVVRNMSFDLCVMLTGMWSFVRRSKTYLVHSQPHTHTHTHSDVVCKATVTNMATTRNFIIERVQNMLARVSRVPKESKIKHLYQQICRSANV